MNILKSIEDFKKYRSGLNDSVGFIPTMGALHRGHLSLCEKSLQDNDFTIVSIFVNPTQFNNQSDLDKYPNQIEDDIIKLQQLGVHGLFMPRYGDLYPDNYSYKVSENNFSNALCGSSRPGHFDGVLTIVLKLLNLSQATNAYFGEKDFQQLKLIEGMVDAFFIPTKIIPMPTIREDSGLAMSSRNLRLTPNDAETASRLNLILKNSPSLESAKSEIEQLGLDVDYVEEHFGRRFVAAEISGVRLIDNIETPNGAKL